VVVTVTRQATDTVVTVSQDLDTQLVVLLHGGGGWREERINDRHDMNVCHELCVFVREINSVF
jgi:hypothetical protein